MSTRVNSDLRSDDPLYDQVQRDRRNRYILGAVGIAGVVAAAFVILYGFVLAAPGF